MRHLRSLALCALAAIGLPGGLLASDHKDAPGTVNLPKADIGDVFVFQGTQTGGLAIGFTVNPLSGSGAPGTDSADKITLDPRYSYQFKIDRDGDLLADLAYKVRATDIDGEPQAQELELRMASGPDAESGAHNGTVVGSGRTTTLNGDLQIVTGKAGELLFAGPRRDPFYFNFLGVESPVALGIRLALAGDDGLPPVPQVEQSFGKTDMTVLMLELPNLADTPVSVWAVVADADGSALDRMGRSSIQAIMLRNTPRGYNAEYYPYGGKNNDAYNAASPSENGTKFGAAFAYALGQLEAPEDKLAEMRDFLVTDVIPFDATQPAGYPNGRNLSEDAVYWTIKYINGGFMAEDADERNKFPTESDQALSEKFPYVAPAVAQTSVPPGGNFME